MKKDKATADADALKYACYFKYYYVLSDITKYLDILSKEINIPVNQLLYKASRDNTAIEIYLIDESESKVVSYVEYCKLDKIAETLLR